MTWTNFTNNGNFLFSLFIRQYLLVILYRKILLAGINLTRFYVFFAFRIDSLFIWNFEINKNSVTPTFKIVATWYEQDRDQTQQCEDNA